MGTGRLNLLRPGGLRIGQSNPVLGHFTYLDPSAFMGSSSELELEAVRCEQPPARAEAEVFGERDLECPEVITQ